MNYADERYVRLFTRDTATWKSWSWDARCLLMAMLRKVDRAGVIDTGKMEKVQAISLICECPKEVVARGLPELVAAETVMLSATSVLMPKFIEAQEARQSDVARQRESREKRVAASVSARIQEEPCHQLSPVVTTGHSSLAVPSLAVPSQPKTTLSTSVDPRVAEVFDFWAVVMGSKAVKSKKRLSAIAARLAEGYTSEQLKAAINGCARTPHNMGQNDRGTKFNDIELICRSPEHVDRFMSAKGAQQPKGFDPDQGIIQHVVTGPPPDSMELFDEVGS